MSKYPVVDVKSKTWSINDYFWAGLMLITSAGLTPEGSGDCQSLKVAK